MNFDFVNISDYFDIVSPGIKPFSGNKRYIATGSLDTDKIVSFDKITYETRPSRANIEVKKDDVLFAKMKDTEKVFIISTKDIENIYSTGFSNLRIKDHTQFEPKFVYYWLKSPEFQRIKNRETTGATQKALNEGRLSKFKIPKPPLETQRKIVAILEKAGKLMELRENANKLTDEFLKSVFYDMFYNKGFEEIKLGDERYFKIIMGQSPAGNSYNKLGKGVPFFQGKKEFGEKYPSVEQWTTEPLKIAKPNDILISVRAPVGPINLANMECCIGRGLASIRCKQEIKTEFVYSSLKVKEKEIDKLGNGSTFKAITSKQLLEIKILLPPINLQYKFAKMVENVEKLKEKQNQSNIYINNLFNSLIQSAFKGELVC